MHAYFRFRTSFLARVLLARTRARRNRAHWYFIFPLYFCSIEAWLKARLEAGEKLARRWLAHSSLDAKSVDKKGARETATATCSRAGDITVTGIATLPSTTLLSTIGLYDTDYFAVLDLRSLGVCTGSTVADIIGCCCTRGGL